MEENPEEEKGQDAKRGANNTINYSNKLRVLPTLQSLPHSIALKKLIYVSLIFLFYCLGP